MQCIANQGVKSPRKGTNGKRKREVKQSALDLAKNLGKCNLV